MSYCMDENLVSLEYLPRMNLQSPTLVTLGTHIETNRCILKPVNSNDYEAIWSLYSDAKVRQYLGGVIDKSTYQNRFDKMCQEDSQNHYWCIQDKQNQQFVGLISLDEYHNADEIEVSYQLSPVWYGIGIGTEVVGAVLDYGLSQLGLRSIVAETQTANVSSCKLLERVGMVREQTVERFGAMQAVYRINKITDSSK